MTLKSLLISLFFIIIASIGIGRQGTYFIIGVFNHNIVDPLEVVLILVLIACVLINVINIIESFIEKRRNDAQRHDRG